MSSNKEVNPIVDPLILDLESSEQKLFTLLDKTSGKSMSQIVDKVLSTVELSVALLATTPMAIYARVAYELAKRAIDPDISDESRKLADAGSKLVTEIYNFLVRTGKMSVSALAEIDKVAATETPGKNWSYKDNGK